MVLSSVLGANNIDMKNKTMPVLYSIAVHLNFSSPARYNNNKKSALDDLILGSVIINYPHNTHVVTDDTRKSYNSSLTYTTPLAMKTLLSQQGHIQTFWHHHQDGEFTHAIICGVNFSPELNSILESSCSSIKLMEIRSTSRKNINRTIFKCILQVSLICNSSNLMQSTGISGSNAMYSLKLNTGVNMINKEYYITNTKETV
jgi:hypothetical protein